MNATLIKETVHCIAPMKYVTISIHSTVDGYEISASTGYRAILPGCSCERIPCMKFKCRKRAHCNGQSGKHVEHVMRLADEVKATYGSAKRGKRNPSQGRERLHDSHIYNGRVPQVSACEWAQGDWAQRMETLIEESLNTESTREDET